MQKSSNTYILAFVVLLAVLSATLLAFVSESLRPLQSANIALEKKKFILTTYLGDKAVEAMSNDEVNTLYDKSVKSLVVDFNGNVLDLTDKDVVQVTEYKNAPEKRKLSVYEINDASGSLSYVVLPLYGRGLWDDIWGYIALESDMSTIKGVVFDHKGETPGLGARITEQQIMDRFVGKKIRDAKGELVSVTMQKGEKGGGAKSIEAYANDPHAVDGMSGATITGNGLNNMLLDYFKSYENYLNSKAKTSFNY